MSSIGMAPALLSGKVRIRWGLWAAVVLMLLVCLFPLWWIAVSAFTPRELLLSSPPRYFPANVTLDNFIALFQQMDAAKALLNSIILAVVTTLATVVLSFLAAYAFARFTFPGAELLFVLLMVSSSLPQIATVIPLFSQFGNLNLIDTLMGLEILMTSSMLPFTVWILTLFIRNVPIEIEEAARVDGASIFTIIVSVIVPLTLPAIGTMLVINFIHAWNELFYPLIFAQTPNSQPLSLGLLNLSGAYAEMGKPWDMISALSLLMILPIVVVVLLFEPLITRGLALGSDK